ncbi:type II toxin-antitoxin system VapC family toxin [Actinomycetospora sp. NBRC 106378]|uniref:type II toxin-antitoxin system VapC family toxin n=1 Tax=Actinomycetospora sp. NBRC 106378 TaxID=3032208 RepID=UPI0024A437D9|nr:type II toxin-antitoxin system VapC family toxin [Actinomycetospora sp. NBRC 106378]GLZ52732.1 ribonuclease VapC37 [Actinomycetospora sp. NBRC 106378]
MLVDANVLLYAEDDTSAHHQQCRAWLTEALNGPRRTGLPWPSLVAFLRIRTNPRVYRSPLAIGDAWAIVEAWLSAPSAWVPVPTERHADVLGSLLRAYGTTANLVPDVHLAALAIEHGVGVCSADTDFARFTELSWLDPTAT